MAKLLLTGKWQMRQLADKPRVKWTPAVVPGCVHTDLLNDGQIPDPHVGTNELDILWIDDADWEYERTFSASAEQAAAAVQQLVFDGLDTIAEVYLNDELVGNGENMFRQYRFNARGKLVEGENSLRVIFRSPRQYALKRREKHTTHVPVEAFHNWALHPPRPNGRSAIRKGQYQFGWDWGIYAPTSGIWQQCYLFTSPDAWIDSTKVIQHHKKKSVELEVKALVSAGKASSGTLVVRVDGEAETRVAARLKRGENQLTASCTIKNPRLWWPAGQGDQPLYQLRVEWISDVAPEVAADSYQTRIGLRTVELAQDKEKVGRTFKFRINGRDVYCKGANWIPDDVFPTRTTPERLEFLLQSTVDANMNMLRIWGGGIYAEEQFLDLCDEKGIMLWHDFMFACAAYPEDRQFLRNVEAEMTYQIRRMFNRASVVLWCGNNENQQMAYHWSAARPAAQQKKIQKAYEKLTYQTQEPLVQREDPTRPWWPSSPSGQRGVMTTGHGDPALGDMHYWAVWHGREPFSAYMTLRPRFCSEFGFQSFPSIDTLKTVARPEDMNVSSPVMEHHQRNMAGNSIITDFLTRHFRFPTTFDGFCYLSQVNQGLSMKMAIEHWRRIKPWCMGTLYWQLNDDWQVASWASIDYLLRWKATHYMARRFNAPLLGSVYDEAQFILAQNRGRPVADMPADAPLQLWATSDEPQPMEGSWQVVAHHAQSGRRLWRSSGKFSLKAGESKSVADLPRQEILAKAKGEAQLVYLTTQVKSGKLTSENTFHFVDLKRTDLPQAKISSKVTGGKDGGFRIELSCDAPAYYVELSTGDYRGVFSDNYFCLTPGSKKVLEFRPLDKVTERQLVAALKVRSVRDTY